LALGVIAVLGHLFPIFAGFRGGKGVATLFGMILAIHAPAALLCVTVFIVILLTTHYVSLSSIMAGFTFPFSIAFIYKTSIPSVLLYGIAICALILITHQKNIERLLKGHESKVYLFKKKKKI
jgi:glycerol-3-phosphate acyltransferase PlsY